MAESDLLADIISLCNELGLLVHYCRDSRHCTGAGLPDLIIVSRTGKGIIFAELKDWNGDLSPEQVTWHWSLIANGAMWRLWKPRDMPEIWQTLSELA